MSVDYDEDTNIGRNDRSSIKSLNSLWKRLPTDAACDNVIDLVTQIQYCKQYEPNGDWDRLEGTADSNMRSLVDLENRTQLKQSIASDFIDDIEQEAEIVKPETLYRQKLSNLMHSYNNKTSRQKYGDSDKFSSYYNSIWAVSKPEEVVPSIRKLIPKESDDEDDDDSDVEIGSIRQNFNDPITLCLFENPYTSDKCKHSYSFNAIKEYLLGQAKICPYSGCSVNISMIDLREDQRLAKR
ncbi:E3 SUMO-protein ligase nse2 [Wallemia ichthyophaga EXF-994]|uniref:E3 SUMO-protein ligase nse2 n=1 Tax=Wallemia ichthyophaga (strain EXF-994 / CBS 113033) TaxID=1299270 RepID=R9ANS9_WALI9|nr:E3 SUMO-protein ligase nse2 [Wallemia ichthyophaga EXF-994]EOR03897.1 E3 SUMO-protein ligase nse2 [Wallemia ichthyophaga EXF-994]